MNQEKSTTQKPRSIEAWTVELSGILSEMAGGQPAIHKVPFDRNENRADIVWWRASGSPAIFIGVSEQEGRLLLPSFSDILDRSWGPGEITAQGPVDPETWDVWNVRFVNGESVRFFVAPEVADAPAGSSLEMLMDIELPIVIRFGHTQMALRDIAALNAGSVIEFERGVDEPIEVMINGHVVALGEAVTVKGSYGIRISEISSRRERLVTSSFAAQEQNT
jgi:flagellar motor switch protein FliN